MIIGRFNNIKIPVARVSRIERLGHWKEHKMRVHTIDEEHFDFDDRDVEVGLQNTIQATIPGNGAKLIEQWSDEDGTTQFDLTEILCFTIDALGQYHAITLNDTYDEPTVLFPDGHVEKYEEQWATFDEFKREIITKNDPA